MSSSLKTPLEPLAFLLIMNEYKERLQRQLDSVSLKKGDDDGKMEKAALSYSILISFLCPHLVSVYIGLRNGDYLLDFPHHHDAC